jgi:hypothetical protein
MPSLGNAGNPRGGYEISFAIGFGASGRPGFIQGDPCDIGCGDFPMAGAALPNESEKD